MLKKDNQLRMMVVVYSSAEENFKKCSGFIYKISVNEKGETSMS